MDVFIFSSAPVIFCFYSIAVECSSAITEGFKQIQVNERLSILNLETEWLCTLSFYNVLFIINTYNISNIIKHFIK